MKILIYSLFMFSAYSLKIDFRSAGKFPKEHSFKFNSKDFCKSTQKSFSVGEIICSINDVKFNVQKSVNNIYLSHNKKHLLLVQEGRLGNDGITLLELDNLPKYSMKFSIPSSRIKINCYKYMSKMAKRRVHFTRFFDVWSRSKTKPKFIYKNNSLVDIKVGYCSRHFNTVGEKSLYHFTKK